MTIMKKFFYFLSICVILQMSTSCVKYDNYDEPSETLKGSIVEKDTHDAFQTEVGDNGVRIKLMEYSWSDNPTPYYFSVKQDGTFNNTKIFKGDYTILPEGAFVPVAPTDTMSISGTVTQNYEVEPFLKIKWVGEPVVNGNSISAQVQITRGTTNVSYQQKIIDVYLFINSSSLYVGNNNKDDRYCAHLTGSDAQNCLGSTVTLTTTNSLPKGRTYYIRVGARIDCNIAGTQRYNYNEPKSVVVPK
jgi:hypothetical protein